MSFGSKLTAVVMLSIPMMTMVVMMMMIAVQASTFKKLATLSL